MTQKELIRAEIERQKEIDKSLPDEKLRAGCLYALNQVLSFLNLLPDELSGWISVKDALPPVDEEVIVLNNQMHGKKLSTARRICFGHIVDRRYAMDYDGWNIPGVEYWIPCPPIPDEPTPSEKCEETEKSALKKCEEVDLEKEIDNTINGLEGCAIRDEKGNLECHLVGHPDLRDFARHFYELGKAKKEE